jgi:REP element-mobilizing transposase RayT
MTFARSSQIDLSISPYYHCMTRCVRQSFLCGRDEETGRDYSHRKPWIVSRIKHLASIFAIHICAYAVMSNHYHLVLFVDNLKTEYWDQTDVISRWAQLFPQDAKAIQYLSAKEAEQKISLWRLRLSDISWFMRCLNETIARSSNKEEEKKGRFWEGRFKSQALLDQGALLSAMVYVDLNPIRAKIASTPEGSDFTSIQERLRTLTKQLKNKSITEKIQQVCEEVLQPKQLMPFSTKQNDLINSYCSSIDFSLSDYIELIDSTGRVIREDKRGAILEDISPILNRLQLNARTWLNMIKNLQTGFSYAIGHSAILKEFGRHYQCHSPKGLKIAQESYFAAA